jgi:hypothetical protein
MGLTSSVRIWDEHGKIGGSTINPLGQFGKKDSVEGNAPMLRFNTEMKLIKPGSSVSDKEIYDCLENETTVKVFS